MSKEKLLIVGNVWPEPSSSAAGTRIIQLIVSLLAQKKFVITFASAALKSEYSFDLSTFGINEISIDLNSSSFDIFMKNLNPKVVLFDRFMIEEQFGWRVRENSPSALTILDTEDLHLLRLGRQKAFKEKRDFHQKDLFSDIAKREIASILRCDLNLIISEVEYEILRNDFKINPKTLLYIPFLIDEINKKTPKFEERIDFAFIGNFYHEPNIDAVLNLKDNIWPLIRKKLPKAKLNIYGAYMPSKILQLNKEIEGFHIKGRIENSKDVFTSARVFLAPLRFGAGQKGKLFETFINGIPSVTTSIGRESMNGDLSWNGFVSDDLSYFAEKAVELYSDKILWQKSIKNGYKILKKRYLKEDFDSIFKYTLIDIQENLEDHRNDNFFGQILQNDLLNATKFMSKWIEEKNKNESNNGKRQD